jgi:hypothetical protein
MAFVHLSFENVLLVCKLTTNHAILEFHEASLNDCVPKEHHVALLS